MATQLHLNPRGTEYQDKYYRHLSWKKKKKKKKKKPELNELHTRCREFSITFVDGELTWTISVYKSYYIYDMNQMQPRSQKTETRWIEGEKAKESTRSVNVAVKTIIVYDFSYPLTWFVQHVQDIGYNRLHLSKLKDSKSMYTWGEFCHEMVFWMLWHFWNWKGLKLTFCRLNLDESHFLYYTFINIPSRTNHVSISVLFVWHVHWIS